MQGRKVRQVFKDDIARGNSFIEIPDLAKLGAGNYLIQVKSDDGFLSKKLIVK